MFVPGKIGKVDTLIQINHIVVISVKDVKVDGHVFIANMSNIQLLLSEIIMYSICGWFNCGSQEQNCFVSNFIQ